MKIKVENPHEFTKRMFYLLWRACGSPFGMGVLQDYAGATEEDVFENVQTRGDYPGHPNRNSKELYGDYVFGRMMKWGCSVENDGVNEIYDREFQPDYQGYSAT